MLAAVIDLCDKKLLGIHIRHLRMQMQLVKHLVIVVHFYSSLSNHIISFNNTSFQLHFVSKIRFSQADSCINMFNPLYYKRYYVLS